MWTNYFDRPAFFYFAQALTETVLPRSRCAQCWEQEINYCGEGLGQGMAGIGLQAWVLSVHGDIHGEGPSASLGQPRNGCFSPILGIWKHRVAVCLCNCR